MEDLESKCYDKFDFKLDDLQILIARAGKCVLPLYVKCRYKFCAFFRIPSFRILSNFCLSRVAFLENSCIKVGNILTRHYNSYLT